MNIVLEVAKRRKGPIYTDGPLIHNPQTIALLEKRQVQVASDLSKANGNGATLIIRTHGVTPERRQELEATGLAVTDATCPIVKRVQGVIKKYTRLGYHIVIVGHRDHPEVAGLIGYSQYKATVVNSLQEVEQLPPMEKVCVVSQTTQRETLWREIKARLEGKYPNCKIVDTICDDPSLRQEEIAELARQVEAMVVVGGKNSSNTARMADIAESLGTPTFHVETDEELEEDQLSRYRIVGVTAGASTPSWLVTRVIDRLEGMKGKKRGKLYQGLEALSAFLINSHLYIALAAACLSYTSMVLQGIPPQAGYMAMAAFYIFAMHILNRYTTQETIEAIGFTEPARVQFYEQKRPLLITLASLAAVGSFAVGGTMGMVPFLLLLLATACGVVYSIKIVPERWSRLMRARRLKDIPASKDLVVALAWASVTTLLPYLGAAQRERLAGAIVAFALIFCLVYIRTVLHDIKDIQGDSMVGKETLPILIGQERTRTLLAVMTGALIPLLVTAGWLGWLPPLSYVLTLPILYMGVNLYNFHRRILYRGLRFEAMVDGVFIFTGGITLLWSVLASGLA